MEWLHLGKWLWGFSEFHSVGISCQQAFQEPRAGQGEGNTPRRQSVLSEVLQFLPCVRLSCSWLVESPHILREAQGSGVVAVEPQA